MGVVERNLAAVGRRDFNCVYLLKMFACISVVGVHVCLILGYDELSWFGHLSHIGVAFFFVCTGYFAFKKIDIEHFDWHSTFTVALKMLRLYVLWTIVYLPHIVKAGMQDAAEFGVLHGMFVECRDVVFNGFQHLWWVHAAFVAFLLLTLLLRCGVGVNGILALGGGLYAIGLLSESWFGLAAPLLQVGPVATFVELYNMVFISTQNGLFRGLLFVSIGLFFAKKDFKLGFPKAVAALVASVVLMVAETCFTGALGLAVGYEVTVALVPLVFFMFYVSACIDFKDRPLWRYLGELSGWVYYLHWWMIVPICSLVAGAFLTATGVTLPGVACLLLALAASVAVSALAIHLSKKPGWKWLRKFR